MHFHIQPVNLMIFDVSVESMLNKQIAKIKRRPDASDILRDNGYTLCRGNKKTAW